MEVVADVAKFIFICIEVLLVFNLLIIVHELGHFLAAKWRGLVVEKFAIWFGKPIWKKKIGGVEYMLGSIPAGGYVAVPQLAPMEMLEGKADHDRSELPPVRALDKIIVAAAGPAASLLLAFIFAVTVWLVGRPVSAGDVSNVIGYVVPDSSAVEAGIEPGDRIVAVNGEPVKRFLNLGNPDHSIIWQVAKSDSPWIDLTIERDGQTRDVNVEALQPQRQGWGRRELKLLPVQPETASIVAGTLDGMPAREAGLRTGDRILSANGETLFSPLRLASIIEANPDAPVELKVQRKGETFTETLTPRLDTTSGEPRHLVGIQWDTRGETALAHPNPFQQVVGSVQTMVATISAVVSPKSDINLQHLSGPVGIMRLYYILFEAPDGWRLVLWFSVILNVNLALLNLLPIPVLDGGHILLAMIEGITRRPLNIRILEFVQVSFTLLLIGLMLYITFYDVLDLPWLRGEPPTIQAPAEPKPSP